MQSGYGVGVASTAEMASTQAESMMATKVAMRVPLVFIFD